MLIDIQILRFVGLCVPTLIFGADLRYAVNRCLCVCVHDEICCLIVILRSKSMHHGLICLSNDQLTFDFSFLLYSFANIYLLSLCHCASVSSSLPCSRFCLFFPYLVIQYIYIYIYQTAANALVSICDYDCFHCS